MRFRNFSLISVALSVVFLASCTSAAASPTPDINAMTTAIYEQVFIPLTQTASASSPTPTATLTPTATMPVVFTATSADTTPLKRPVVTAPTGCWTGPGNQYKLISNIEEKRYVELLGIGSVSGWYIIRNPYNRAPCWIEAIYLKLDPRVDTSAYPTMMPGPQK